MLGIGLNEGAHCPLISSPPFLFIVRAVLSFFSSVYFCLAFYWPWLFPSLFLTAGQEPQLTKSYKPLTGKSNISMSKVTQRFYPVARYGAFYWLMLSIVMVFLDTLLLLAQNQAVSLFIPGVGMETQIQVTSGFFFKLWNNRILVYEKLSTCES